MRSGIAWVGSSERHPVGELARHRAVHEHDRDHQHRPGQTPPRRRAAAGEGARCQPVVHASYRRRVSASIFSTGFSCSAPAAAPASDATASGSVEDALVAADDERRLAGGRQRAQRVVEAAHAPAGDGEDLVAGREAGLLAGAAAQHVGQLDAGERAFADANAEALRQRRRLRLDLDAEALQQRRQRQLVGAVDPGGELARVRAAADRLERRGDVGLVDRAAVARLPTAGA